MIEVEKLYGKDAAMDLKLIVVLNRCLQSLQKREFPYIRSCGITVSQFGVLELLYHKGSLRISEIIDKTLSSGGNMTVIIDNLERDGLVQRIDDPDDRRSTMVNITENGAKLIREIFPGHISNLSELLKCLSVDEKEQLIKLSKKLGKCI